MTFPQILEVAIGLVLTYYIMGSVVSAVTQYALDTLRIKRKIFEEYMGLIFGKRDVKRILALPQVKSLGTKVTVNILVDSFWDIFGFTAYERSPSATEEMLIRLVNMIPEDSAGKQAMVTWINCAITNTNDLRVRITDYFAGLKEEIEANYSSKSRKYMVIISLAITIITG
ncbi:MAG TPA: hypothetical protein PKW10_14455, partial [Saprospiraceae bacterium]|nr:hypothetical protein [Saprospiraceae bacterium]